MVISCESIVCFLSGKKRKMFIRKNGPEIWLVSLKVLLLHSNQGNDLDGVLVQLVRIHACHAWGHGFESRTHRKIRRAIFGFFYCFCSASVFSGPRLMGNLMKENPTNFQVLYFYRNIHIDMNCRWGDRRLLSCRLFSPSCIPGRGMISQQILTKFLSGVGISLCFFRQTESFVSVFAFGDGVSAF